MQINQTCQIYVSKIDFKIYLHIVYLSINLSDSLYVDSMIFPAKITKICQVNVSPVQGGVLVAQLH